MVNHKVKSHSKSVAQTAKKHLRLFLVPHKGNDYRPHLIRRYGLMVLLVLVIGLQLVYNLTKTGSVLGRVTNVTSSGLLVSTNDVRKANRLSDLKINQQLSQAAQEKAQDMIQKGYWSHVSPDGTQPWYWIDTTGYNYEAAGENLAKNFSTSQAVITAWMDSKTHRANVLSTSYQDVGFGMADGDVDGKYTSVVVALYAEPITTAVAGAKVEKSINQSSSDSGISLMSRIGLGIESLTPAAIVSVMLLLVAAAVAITAHFYRSKLPKRLRQTWYRHHGAAKASGLLTVAAFVVLLYGGGQI